MRETPFYKHHWIDIGQERLDRYQRMFAWNPGSKILYDPANIREGHVVAEFGCGPGHTAVEIANWVGREGHVHALDINETFLALTRDNARKAHVDDRFTIHRSDGTELPLRNGSLDRITTRNTLIYVDDPSITLGAFKRALRPGGRMHAIEGDWPMMVVEPIPTAEWERVVTAARHACRSPEIGRRMTGLLARSGFRDIEVQVVTRPDTDGRLLPMIETILDYARDSGAMPDAELDGIVPFLRQAIVERTYLVVAPQFVVTGRR